MNDKTSITITQGSRTVGCTIPHIDITITELLEIYAGLLKTLGYVFDGEIGIIDNE